MWVFKIDRKKIKLIGTCGIKKVRKSKILKDKIWEFKKNKLLENKVEN